MVLACQKTVHNVQDEMAEFVVPNKGNQNSLTTQGMQNIRGFPQKRISKKGKEERILPSKAHKKV